MSKYLPFEPTGALNLWDHIVARFTQRRLTYGSDRLPALSGIAKTIYFTGALGKYYAGLWEARLAEGLLWFVDPSITGSDLLPPSPVPMAPSWSWASINGAWDYRRTNPELESLYAADDTLYVTKDGLELSGIGFACKDLSMELHLKRPNVFGEIELGKISLSGWVTSAMVQYEATNPDESYAMRFKSQRVNLINRAGTAMMTSAPFMDFVLDHGENPIPSGSTVECVGIQPDIQHRDRWHGLVLLPVNDGNGMVYRRIGKFLGTVGWFSWATTPLQKLTII